MSSTEVTIPHDWTPRPHQRALFDQFGHGKTYRRGCAVWHRRAGKDSCALNLTARDMFRRVGTYWHLFPEQAQARRAIWNGIDRAGRRIIDQMLPPAVRARTSAQEMLIETVNGSIWQMAGSDNFDSLVGSNPVGVVFSEWALSHPDAWEYLRPILVENDGWALFIYTPRGRNHGHATYMRALQADTWFCQRADGGGYRPDRPRATEAEARTIFDVFYHFLLGASLVPPEAWCPGPPPGLRPDRIEQVARNELGVPGSDLTESSSRSPFQRPTFPAFIRGMAHVCTATFQSEDQLRNPGARLPEWLPHRQAG